MRYQNYFFTGDLKSIVLEAIKITSRLNDDTFDQIQQIFFLFLVIIEMFVFSHETILRFKESTYHVLFL